MILSFIGSIFRKNGFKIIAIFVFVITFYLFLSVNEKNKINLYKQNFTKDVKIKTLKKSLQEQKIIHKDVYLENKKALMQIELTAQNLRANRQKLQKIRDEKLKKYYINKLMVKDNSILAEMINCEFRNFNNIAVCY